MIRCVLYSDISIVLPAVDEQNAQTEKQEEKTRALLESVTTALTTATTSITTDTLVMKPKVTIVTPPSMESSDHEDENNDVFPLDDLPKSPEISRSIRHSAYMSGTKAKIERKKAG